MLSDHHFTEEQIDSIVRSASMTQDIFEHLFECESCFAEYENTRLLTLTLSGLSRREMQFESRGDNRRITH